MAADVDRTGRLCLKRGRHRRVGHCITGVIITLGNDVAAKRECGKVIHRNAATTSRKVVEDCDVDVASQLDLACQHAEVIDA